MSGAHPERSGHGSSSDASHGYVSTFREVPYLLCEYVLENGTLLFMSGRQTPHTEVAKLTGRFLMVQSGIEWGNGRKIYKKQHVWASGVIRVPDVGSRRLNWGNSFHKTQAVWSIL